MLKLMVMIVFAVPVYPQPNDKESFWLFKVRSVGVVIV